MFTDGKDPLKPYVGGVNFRAFMPSEKVPNCWDFILYIL